MERMKLRHVNMFLEEEIQFMQLLKTSLDHIRNTRDSSE